MIDYILGAWMIVTTWGLNYDKDGCVKGMVLNLEQLGGSGNFKDEDNGKR